MSEWLTKTETCKALGISLPTLCRKMASGLIPYYKSGTSRTCKVLFRKSDILKYINKVMKKGK